jgi:hypothetical protein
MFFRFGDLRLHPSHLRPRFIDRKLVAFRTASTLVRHLFQINGSADGGNAPKRLPRANTRFPSFPSE